MALGARIGCVPSGALQVQAPHAFDMWVEGGHDGNQHELLTGDVATDGSRKGTWANLGCTGWAAVVLKDGEATVLVSIWGAMEHSLPVQRRIARAELYAVLMAMRNCTPPLRVHTDCALILRGVEAGCKWCCHSLRPHADMWRAIWDKINDIGLGSDGVSFYKIAAHVTKSKRAEATQHEQWLYTANEEADTRAKAGTQRGVNAFLHFIGAAMDEAGEQVAGALDYISALAGATFAQHDGWADADPPGMSRAGKRRAR